MKATWKKVYPPFGPSRECVPNEEEYKCIMIPPPVFNLRSEIVSIILSAEDAAWLERRRRIGKRQKYKR